MNLESFLKIAGLGLTVIGLGFTGYQVREANKTLVFTTEQNLYKESRDILKFLAENPGVIQAAQSEDISALDAKERVKLAAQIGVLLNFYNSILLDKNKDYVTADFRKSLISDFCILAKLSQINRRLPEKADQPFQNLASIKRSNCHA